MEIGRQLSLWKLFFDRKLCTTYCVIEVCAEASNIEYRNGKRTVEFLNGAFLFVYLYFMLNELTESTEVRRVWNS